MIKFFLFFALISLSFISCQNQNQNQNNNLLLENEIENWKQNLIETGKLGQHCKDDFKEWIKENPNNVFGISDELTIQKSDFNEDGMEDIYAIMEIGDPCNGGNAISSDYSVFIYSKNGKYLRDENIIEKIEKGLNEKLSRENKFSISQLTTSLKSFDKTINGSSSIHLVTDASCCPSYSVNFSYNIKTEMVTSEVIKNE